jgi:hypothetical protein
MDKTNTTSQEVIGVGRLLRGSATGCVVGCRVSQINAPSLGGMVRIPLDDKNQNQIYGLIYDINIDDDGLVRQLITSDHVDSHIIMDNRLNRNVPVEISVLFIGYEVPGEIFHLLPPRPPLTLDEIFLCSPDDLCRFTNAGRFGYFRHILRAVDLPISELLASHLRQTDDAQCASGHPQWVEKATQELITLLRDDYPTLMGVLSALSDAHINLEYPTLPSQSDQNIQAGGRRS